MIKISTKYLQILGSLGSKIYTQNDEPANAKEGALWVDMDEYEESSSIDADTLGGKNPSEYVLSDEFTEIVEAIKAELKSETTERAGFIYPFAGTTVPIGYLLCDGAEYSRTAYPELFAAIGTIYGAGDGSTTFNVPNLATRVPVGKGSGYALGATGGEEKHTLTVDEMPAHNHSLANPVGDDSGDVNGYQWKQNMGDWGKMITEVAGGSQAHNNMQPYTVVNYIIATGKYV